MDALKLTETLLEDEDAGRALEVCEQVLRDAGCTVELRGDEGALVARRGQGGVAFSGHVDVVPAGEAWTRDPFGGSVEGERLFGRGASDMRGPVACMLCAVEATEGPVQVVLTTDEETTMAGVRSLVDQGVLASAPLVVVGEPTGLSVATASKGVLWVRVVASGDRGHASTPRGERGPSGPERLVEVLASLPEEPIRLEYPGLGGATAALTGVGSEGTPFNVLAGKAWARVDCRFPPPGTPEDVEASLRSKLGLPREGVSLEVAKREPAFLGAKQAAEEIVEVLESAGVGSGVSTVSYASEAGHWQRVAPTVLLGPGSIDRAHGPDEFVTRRELEEGMVAYEALVREQGRFSGSV